MSSHHFCIINPLKLNRNYAYAMIWTNFLTIILSRGLHLMFRYVSAILSVHGTGLRLCLSDESRAMLPGSTHEQTTQRHPVFSPTPRVRLLPLEGHAFSCPKSKNPRSSLPIALPAVLSLGFEERILAESTPIPSQETPGSLQYVLEKKWSL